MEIVSENLDNKNNNYLSKVVVGDENNENHSLKSNKNDSIIYSLNPLLNESLNNLVKRFERTKIPKPPPTKGHGIRRKMTRNHHGSSLPNIFLPSIFDNSSHVTDSINFTTNNESKYFDNNHKKVQWTNKLNLDLEKMKSLFQDNYSHWCTLQQKQKIHSISLNVLNSSSEIMPGTTDQNDTSKENADFICSRSQDDKNMTIKFTKCDRRPNNNGSGSNNGNNSNFGHSGNDNSAGIGNDNVMETYPTQHDDETEELNIQKITSSTHIVNMDTNDCNKDVSYSTHLYLDGAIIEPISPASPIQSGTETGSGNRPGTAEQYQSDNANHKKVSNSDDGVIDAPSSDVAVAMGTTATITTSSVSSLSSPTQSKAKRGRKSRKKKLQSTFPPSKKSKSTNATTSSKEQDQPIAEPTATTTINKTKTATDVVRDLTKSTQMATEPSDQNSNEIIIIHLADNIDLINLDEMAKSEEKTKNSPDQANDLEILSKSITNSVDTSMLPPRKRYKRLMYFENNNKSASPRDMPSLDNLQTTESKTVIDMESASSSNVESKFEDDKMSTKLPNVPRSRSKRKKKTMQCSTTKSGIVDQSIIDTSSISVIKADETIAASTNQQAIKCDIVTDIKTKVEQTMEKCNENKINNSTVNVNNNGIDSITKPESLKRSKREAAARGFANMVAMSLNNSNSSSNSTLSQSHQDGIPLGESKSSNMTTTTTTTTTATTKKSNSNVNIIEIPSSDMVTAKVSFKRPRKSKATDQLSDPTAKNKMMKSDTLSLDNVSLNSGVGCTSDSVSAKNVITATPKITTTSYTKSKDSSTHVESTIVNSSSSGIISNIKSKGSGGSKKSKEIIVVQDETNILPPPSPSGTIISNDSNSHHENSNTIIKYRRIRTNTYIDPKPLYWFEEVERCGCKPSKLRYLYEKQEINNVNNNKSSSSPIHTSSLGTAVINGNSSKSMSKKRNAIVWDCSDSCLNRLTYTECQAKNCQCGDACGNQKIRKGEWVPGLKMVEFPGKGKGVLTTRAIREGTFVMEYVGEVINEHTFQDRMMNVYRDDPHHFCLHLDGDMLIDAYRSGSMARFVNHSCQPNCEMQKWMVNGAYRMCLFAIEDIPADTELCYDYNFCSFNTKNTQICLCGSAACRGFIGSKPRAEQTESQKDRKKLLYIFGRLLSCREKLFILRNSVFLLRNREQGRCQRLGIRKPQLSHGNRLPSTISEIKRRKAKKNQFLTQMSALNSIRSIKTRQLQNAQDNETLTRVAQLGQVLKDLYNTLLDQKDPVNSNQQLVAPFINCLNRKKYPEFYRMIGPDSVASLNQIYSRLLDGAYVTMMAFDQDLLQMLHNIEFYAGKQSNIGQCAERIKPIYRELKTNSIALYEALTDEVFDEKDKQKLQSNNLQLITSALAALKSSHHHHHHSTTTTSELIGSDLSNTDSMTATVNVTVAGGSSAISGAATHKIKRRKQASSGGGNNAGARNRLERGAEVIKCICGFLIEAGHVMVQCDRCFVWQHAYCMNVARSSELADVTRMEPYYCHICLNIPTESLIREIPRHFVISDETIGSDNTLFWTLLHSDNNLLKIDDFVYIMHNATASNLGSTNATVTSTDTCTNSTTSANLSNVNIGSVSGVTHSRPMRSSKQSKNSPTNTISSASITNTVTVTDTSSNNAHSSLSSSVSTVSVNQNLSGATTMPIDLTLRTIMRIYSLWKDSSGRRWMEGGLFLRPYDSQLKSLLDTKSDMSKLTNSNKRKFSSSTSSPIDISTHKWHQHEVVYTDLTKILPVDECLGRCFVLNSYTFRQGKPLLQNSTQNPKNLDVFVCDWMINQHGEWSELDPAYLKINTKAYCFERFQDNSSPNSNTIINSNTSSNNENITLSSTSATTSSATGAVSSTNERFCRQYLSEDLLNLDKGFLPLLESTNQKALNRNLSNEERISRKVQSLKKLLNKLVEFAYERNQNLPISSTTSSASGSTTSSRGASPLCENSGGKSPLRPLLEAISHGPRKSFNPRKWKRKCSNDMDNDDLDRKNEEHSSYNKIDSSQSVSIQSAGFAGATTAASPIESKDIGSMTIASDASDSSPQLMIVVDEFQQTPKNSNDINLNIINKINHVPVASSVDGVDLLKEVVEKCPSIDDKDLDEKTVSSVKENFDDQSNFGSEINFGDFVNLLKNTVESSKVRNACDSDGNGGSSSNVIVGDSGTKSSKSNKLNTSKMPVKKSSKKAQTKKKATAKKSEIKPVSEISAIEDEWVPINKGAKTVSNNNRPRTRSRKGLLELSTEETEEKSGVESSSLSNNTNSNSNNTEVELILTGLNIKGIFTSNENSNISNFQHNSECDRERSLEAKLLSSSNQISPSMPILYNSAASNIVSCSGSSGNGLFECTTKIDEDDDESTKSCFVKLERMKVKQKKERERANTSSDNIKQKFLLKVAHGPDEGRRIRMCEGEKEDDFISKSLTTSNVVTLSNLVSAATKNSLKSRSQSVLTTACDTTTVTITEGTNDIPTAVASIITATIKESLDLSKRVSVPKCSLDVKQSIAAQLEDTTLGTMTASMITSSSKNNNIIDENENLEKTETYKNSSSSFNNLSSSSLLAAANRSKRKKGVPKRIPFDFSYTVMNPMINALTTVTTVPPPTAVVTGGNSTSTMNVDTASMNAEQTVETTITGSQLTTRSVSFEDDEIVDLSAVCSKASFNPLETPVDHHPTFITLPSVVSVSNINSSTSSSSSDTTAATTHNNNNNITSTFSTVNNSALPPPSSLGPALTVISSSTTPTIVVSNNPSPTTNITNNTATAIITTSNISSCGGATNVLSATVKKPDTNTLTDTAQISAGTAIVMETRHITAANDFSSIENISSN